MLDFDQLEQEAIDTILMNIGKIQWIALSDEERQVLIDKEIHA